MSTSTFFEKSPFLEKYPLRVKFLSLKDNSPSFFPLHWHEHMEILYLVEGSCKITNGGEIIDADKKDIIIINANELHSTQRSENCLIMCMHISMHFFSDTNYENLFFKTHIKTDNTAINYMEEILKETKNKNSGYDMQLKGHTYLLMAHFFKKYRVAESEIQIKKKSFLKINAILQYISANYNTKLTSTLLAKHFFLSEYYFCHFFKAQTGVSPINYINNLRVEKAMSLLKSTNLSITEIALNVGFEDSNYFTKKFKNYVGSTPREYRKLTKT